MLLPPIKINTVRLNICTLNKNSCSLVLEYWLKNKFFFTPYLPVFEDDFFTLEKQAQLLVAAEEKRLLDNKYLFFVFLKNSDELIGDFAFSNVIRGAFNSAHLGYKLSQRYNNNGFITEALSAGIHFAFNSLHLHRVEANIMPSNTASIKVIKKLGFEQIGLAKKYLKINGVWENHIQYQLINNFLE